MSQLEDRFYDNLKNQWNYLTKLITVSMEYNALMFKEVPCNEKFVVEIQGGFNAYLHDYHTFTEMSFNHLYKSEWETWLFANSGNRS